MDAILSSMEDAVYEPLVSSFTSKPHPFLERDTLLRQTLGLTLIVNLAGYFLYFFAAGMSYVFIWDKRFEKHHLFLKNQVSREIGVSSRSILLMSFLTMPFFLLEVRGYSRLHDELPSAGSLILSIVTFVLFTDCAIYWIHRWLHAPLPYKFLHKTHHTWKIPTPFASHAFHPMDGFLQSVPYHIYIFLFPMNKWLYLGMFTLVNFWTVSIHDGDFRVPNFLKPYVNGAAHHTDHHLFYNFNYGQFFTLWDRIGGSFKEPSSFQKDSPLRKLTKHNN